MDVGRKVAIGILFAGVSVAGCGGDKEVTLKAMDEAGICIGLSEGVVTDGPDAMGSSKYVDLAERAGNNGHGYFRIDWDDTPVEVMAFKTADAAESALGQLRSASLKDHENAADSAERRGNAVLVYTGTPEPTRRERINTCLDDAGFAEVAEKQVLISESERAAAQARAEDEAEEQQQAATEEAAAALQSDWSVVSRKVLESLEFCFNNEEEDFGDPDRLQLSAEDLFAGEHEGEVSSSPDPAPVGTALFEEPAEAPGEPPVGTADALVYQSAEDATAAMESLPAKQGTLAQQFDFLLMVPSRKYTEGQQEFFEKCASKAPDEGYAAALEEVGQG